MQQIPKESTNTDAYYTLHANQWTIQHGDANFWEKQLSDFQNFLPEGYILEIGTGGGRDARNLIELGYRYKGIEPSGMIDIAKFNLPSADIEQIHVEELNYPGKFDGFWASASLLHHPKNKIDFALQKINQSLREGGVGFISLKKHIDDLPNERMVSDKFGERFFSFWLTPEFEEVLKRNGFEVLVNEEVEKGNTVWLTFIVRKVIEN